MIQLRGSSMSSSSRKRFELKDLKNGAHLNVFHVNSDRLIWCSRHRSLTHIEKTYFEACLSLAGVLTCVFNLTILFEL